MNFSSSVKTTTKHKGYTVEIGRPTKVFVGHPFVLPTIQWVVPRRFVVGPPELPLRTDGHSRPPTSGLSHFNGEYFELPLRHLNVRKLPQSIQIRHL